VHHYSKVNCHAAPTLTRDCKHAVVLSLFVSHSFSSTCLFLSQGEGYDRDEDHLAQMQELLGRMPKAIAMNGHYSLELFNRKGELRNIRRLKFWDLTSVLVDKYRMHIDQAAALTDFLVPMLEFDTSKRATAAHMLTHPWLQVC